MGFMVLLDAFFLHELVMISDFFGDNGFEFFYFRIFFLKLGTHDLFFVCYVRGFFFGSARY